MPIIFYRIMLIIIKYMIFVSILVSIQYQAFAQDKIMLRDYLWKHRVILLFAPNTDHDLLKQQHALLRADTHGLSERDIIIFQVIPNQIEGQNTSWDAKSSHMLRDSYRVGDEAFCVILLGKDGSEKLRRKELLPCKELYSVIDAMPMRQREMREDKD